MKIVLLLIFLLGLTMSVIIPVLEQARAVAIWSDFKAFGSRAAADPAGERILAYGGENKEENFENLLDRLFGLNDSSPARPLGFAIAFLAAFGLIIELRRTKGDKPDDTC